MVTTDDDELADALRDVPHARHPPARARRGDVDARRLALRHRRRSASTTGSPTSSARSGEHQLGAARRVHRRPKRGGARATANCSTACSGSCLPASRRRRRAPRLPPVRRALPRGSRAAPAGLRPAPRADGIGTQLHYIPIPAHDLYRSLGYSMDGLPAGPGVPRAGAVAADVPHDDRGRRRPRGRRRSAARSRCRCHERAERWRGAHADPLPGAFGAGAGVIPGASQTLSKRPDAVGSGRRADVPRARGGRARLGRRRQPVPRLPDGARAGPARLLQPGRRPRDRRAAAIGDHVHASASARARGGRADASVVPGAERVRFAKTGSDVTSAAVRLARAHTGRERVIVAGYHGWHDWYIGSTSWPLGVPEAVRSLVDDGPVRRPRRRSRPPSGRPTGRSPAWCSSPSARSSRRRTRSRRWSICAHAHGALAVFDEIITGFRLAPGGAQEHFGVLADLGCFGKALGNGMPISALVGRAEIMDGLTSVFFSGTHGGETLSLAAARATLDVLAQRARARAPVGTRATTPGRRRGRDPG